MTNATVESFLKRLYFFNWLSNSLLSHNQNTVSDLLKGSVPESLT